MVDRLVKTMPEVEVVSAYKYARTLFIYHRILLTFGNAVALYALEFQHKPLSACAEDCITDFDITIERRTNRDGR
ncbi:hypothetical protein WJ04_01525 [Burkholderia vietnamiensis]|nr:hypothetical protein WJ04_01525 [Burkholderia vietnamiensis]